MVVAYDVVELELMLSRFRRLMSDVMRGLPSRNVFQRWEVELLLDLDNCDLKRRRIETLRSYQRAVEKRMEQQMAPPFTLSEFLRRRALRRQRRLQSAARSK
jgi:hypothetical protein